MFCDVTLFLHSGTFYSIALCSLEKTNCLFVLMMEENLFCRNVFLQIQETKSNFPQVILFMRHSLKCSMSLCTIYCGLYIPLSIICIRLKIVRHYCSSSVLHYNNDRLLIVESIEVYGSLWTYNDTN